MSGNSKFPPINLVQPDQIDDQDCSTIWSKVLFLLDPCDRPKAQALGARFGGKIVKAIIQATHDFVTGTNSISYQGPEPAKSDWTHLSDFLQQRFDAICEIRARQYCFEVLGQPQFIVACMIQDVEVTDDHWDHLVKECCRGSNAEVEALCTAATLGLLKWYLHSRTLPGFKDAVESLNNRCERFIPDFKNWESQMNAKIKAGHAKNSATIIANFDKWLSCCSHERSVRLKRRSKSVEDNAAKAFFGVNLTAQLEGYWLPCALWAFPIRDIVEILNRLAPGSRLIQDSAQLPKLLESSRLSLETKEVVQQPRKKFDEKAVRDILSHNKSRERPRLYRRTSPHFESDRASWSRLAHGELSAKDFWHQIFDVSKCSTEMTDSEQSVNDSANQ